MPLSDTACRTAKAKDAAYKLTDGDGMYLLVKPNGAKLWRFDYRFDQKRKTLAFGVYPDVTLATARDKRLAARQQIAIGTDPAEVKKQAKAERTDTFEAVAREWHGIQSAGWVNEHAARVLSRLERDVFPEFGSKPIAEIEAPEILSMIRKVEAREALDIAKRLRQGCGQIFRYAIATGRAKRDPAADLKGALKPSPKPQHMASLKAKEIPDFLSRLRSYDGDESTRLAIEFVLHTFVRTNELRFALKTEFDGDLWRIPGERMKMEREHIVPLTKQSKAILARLIELSGNGPWLLPGIKGKPISQNTLIFACYRMGYRGRLTIHGLRGTASTILNESGLFNSDWIERQLAHVEENKIRGAYNAAEWLPQRTEMMHWYSDYLTQRAAEVEQCVK